LTALRRSAAQTFDSLHVFNYRRFFGGQIVSLTGTWMQTVAEMWLVLHLTGNGVALGLTTALQFLPVLLGATWGGLLADRLPKRRLLIATQAAQALPALALWGLTVSGSVALWMIYALVFLRGCVTAVDNPTRQAFTMEMVGPKRLANAVALNSALLNSARIFGPAIAGVMIATSGLSLCFLINGISFLAVIASLATMRPAELHPSPPARRGSGQLRAALRHVWITPELRVPLLVTAVVGTLAFNFQVSLPLLARFTFHGDGATYAALATAMGIGAIAGALAVAHRGRPTRGLLSGAAVAFGALILFVAAAPTLRSALALLVPMGFASIVFASTANASLQLASHPAMRGRVMALYAMVFFGSAPIGGPLVGWVAGAAGPRAALALGGVATVLAGLAAVAWHRRERIASAAEAVVKPTVVEPRATPPTARARSARIAQATHEGRSRWPSERPRSTTRSSPASTSRSAR
jgi:MFS family permease